MGSLLVGAGVAVSKVRAAHNSSHGVGLMGQIGGIN